MLKSVSHHRVTATTFKKPHQFHQNRSMSTHSSLGKRLVDKKTDLGKVSLVTGGSSGIGRDCCIRMAQEGSRVLITDIPNLKNQGESLAQLIRDHHGEAIFVPLDVRDEKQWKSAVEVAENEFGPLDVLVNNAGIGGISPAFEDMSLDEWRALMAVNSDGVFLGSKYAIRSMKHRANDTHTWGSIINMSSILGLVGHPFAPTYSASKGAVRLLTKSLALYCAQTRIPVRVNSLHPGYVETPILDALDEEAKKQLAALHPMGRIGEPREISDGVVFLASDESSFMTGSELVIDGGYTAQ